MAITATFVSSTQFTVTGDRTEYIKHGLRIQALMGVDGTIEGTVDSSSYSAITELTTCTIEESVLTANLATIKLGATYADPDNNSSNIGPHGHTGADDGGLMAAASISAEQMIAVESLVIPSAGDDDKIMRVRDTEDGYELIALAGATDEIDISHEASTTTIGISDNFTLDEASVIFDTTYGHAHTGGDSSSIQHSDLESIGANDHHAQVHGSADHSGNIGDEADINFDSVYGHAHTGADSCPVQHSDLENIGTNTHAEIDTAISNSAGHIAASAPHGGHESTANKGAANGYMGLGADALADPTDLGTGTPDDTKVLYGNRTWGVPPGATGGEANTASNQGGGVGIYKQKTGVDLELKTLNSDEFEEAADVISLKSGVGGGGTDVRLERTDANTVTLSGIAGTSKTLVVNGTSQDLSTPKTIDTDSAADYLISESGGTVSIGSTAFSALTTGFNDYSILYVYMTDNSACWNFSSPTSKDYRNSLIISDNAPVEVGGYMAASGDGVGARHIGWVILNASRQMDHVLSIASAFNPRMDMVFATSTGATNALTPGGAEVYPTETSKRILVPAGNYLRIEAMTRFDNIDNDAATCTANLRETDNLLIWENCYIGTNITGRVLQEYKRLFYSSLREVADVVRNPRIGVLATGASSTPTYNGDQTKIEITRIP